MARFVEVYPDGLSPHGLRYVAADVDGANWRSWTIEAVVEMVRRESYPDRPSRFHCMFACSTPAEAKDFATRNSPPGHRSLIWEVDAQTSFLADMNLLRGHSLMQMQVNAERYWMQQRSDEPLIEHLVRLPATVGQCVPI